MYIIHVYTMYVLPIMAMYTYIYYVQWMSVQSCIYIIISTSIMYACMMHFRSAYAVMLIAIYQMLSACA